MEAKMILGLILGLFFLALTCVIGIWLAIRETKRYNKSIEAEANVISQLLFIASITIVKFSKSVTNKRAKNCNN